MNNDELVKFYERRFGPFIHMAPNDIAIWTRYLMQGGEQFAPFQYDVRVGDGTQMPAGTSPQAVNIAYALTTKRIDVICEVANAIRIIEVKQRAGLSAIGQLIGYEQLFRKSTGTSRSTEKWLITDTLQPDMKPLLLENNINFYETGL